MWLYVDPQKQMYTRVEPQSRISARATTNSDRAKPYHLLLQHVLGISRRGRGIEMGMDMDWVVRLGREEWQRFTYERSENNPLRLLGSVA